MLANLYIYIYIYIYTHTHTHPIFQHQKMFHFNKKFKKHFSQIPFLDGMISMVEPVGKLW